jgi:hypothetical protein
MVGTALRFAIALDLHTHNPDPSHDVEDEQNLNQTWWSLHNLDSLLCSLTGRPCMLRPEEVLTPLPREVVKGKGQQNSENTPSMAFPDAQVRLAIITQKTMSQLYTQRRTARPWAQTQATITSLTSELDEWALEAMLIHVQDLRSNPTLEKQHILLKKQYCRLKILITRPSVQLVERCYQAGTEDIAAFDLQAAEMCLRTAQDVTAILPDEVDLEVLYEKGPWWTIVHNSKSKRFPSQCSHS